MRDRADVGHHHVPEGLAARNQNWKRAVACAPGSPNSGIRASDCVYDLRHIYGSLARSAGADMKPLQVTMGHASIMVTAHTNADLFDSDLDRVTDALYGLGG
jgi:integrase